MSVKTLIFGARSNLSKQLHICINDTVLVSSSDFLDNKNYLEHYQNEEVQIIINSFYPASKLNDFSEPLKYIQDTIYIFANLLEQIKLLSLNVKKIIYTSSASVYGNNNYCNENDNLMPLNLQASLKVSSEKLLKGFCNDMKIDYVIARVFNMYGKNDNFSVISKIINSVLDKETIPLINSGTAIRDFIHINDVVKSYIKLLDLTTSQTVNIASGDGVSIKMILDYLKLKGYTIDIENSCRDEIKVSIANVEKLNMILDTSNFNKVVDFIETELQKEIN